MISDSEKKKRQHKKELKSLRNKLGNSIVWFDALSLTQQYDFLFAWKKEKFTNTLKKPEKTIVVQNYTGYQNGKFRVLKKQVEVVSYPPSLKHFVKNSKQYFNVNINKLRESKLKHLLNQK